MKTKAIKKGILSILLAAVMLCTLMPLSAMAKTTDADGKVTSTSFTLINYKYGMPVTRCIGSCADSFTAFVEDIALLELNGDRYDRTEDTYLNAGKQYYYGIAFSPYSEEDWTEPVEYSHEFDFQNTVLTINGNSTAYAPVYSNSIENEAFYVVIYKLPILEAVPYGINVTTVVNQGGNVAPAKGEFELEVLNVEENSNSPIADYTVGGKNVTTDGKGSFDTKLTIANNDYQKLLNLSSEGVLVKQKKGDVNGWTYDESIWFVQLHVDPEVNALGDSVETMPNIKFDCYKGKMVDGEFVPDSETPADKITLTNTYTENKVETPAEPDLPKAGDSNNIAFWIALLFVSGAGAVGTVVFSQKRKNTK